MSAVWYRESFDKFAMSNDKPATMANNIISVSHVCRPQQLWSAINDTDIVSIQTSLTCHGKKSAPFDIAKNDAALIDQDISKF